MDSGAFINVVVLLTWYVIYKQNMYALIWYIVLIDLQ